MLFITVIYTVAYVIIIFFVECGARSEAVISRTFGDFLPLELI